MFEVLYLTFTKISHLGLKCKRIFGVFEATANAGDESRHHVTSVIGIHKTQSSWVRDPPRHGEVSDISSAGGVDTRTCLKAGSGDLNSPLNRKMPEQKISRVLFPRLILGAMIIYLGLLSPEDSSDLPGSDSPRLWRGKRGGQPLLPYAVLLSGGVYPDPCYHGNAWSLTPRFHPCPSTSSGRFVFCGTFRPLRAHELRGTLPCTVWCRACPGELGLSSLRSRHRRDSRRSSILLWQLQSGL